MPEAPKTIRPAPLRPAQRPTLLRIVETQAPRPSRAALLHEAHQQLAEAEANLRHLAAGHPRTPSGRPALFRRPR